ncbi:DUF4113 domain-containing protein [Salmonella enterica]|uniref:DUF4113 domain-containing protein n=1 Tax=Salmonella enterica TaxID=28901 RepID=A0A7U6BL92_SALER|nr:hypothetical protein CHC34_14025 [Salmonella enterica]EAP0952944.1 DUF4113 domain-containing protein [Salmonella enterica]EDZ9928366.1 DUF4113 domain-containing protein [Salmonella enterica]
MYFAGQEWAMKREMLSPRTRYEDLLQVK